MKRVHWRTVLMVALALVTVLGACKAKEPTATPATAAPTKAPATKEVPTKPPAAEPVEIEYWTSWAPDGAQGMVLQALLDEFNTSQSEVFVTHIYMGSTRDEKIAAGLAAGDPPDVAWISSAGEKYYEEDLLVPMERVYEYVPEEDLLASMVDNLRYLGKAISLPHENSCLAVLYNKGMLDEKGVEYPPEEIGAWTWTDFVEMAKLFSDPDEGKFGYDPRWAGAMLYSQIWSAGTGVFSEDLRTNMVCGDAKTRADTIKALNRFYDMVWVSKITANDVGDQGFGSGDMAFAITGPWDMPRYKESSPDLDIGVASFPADEDTGMAISYWYAKALAVFRTTPEQEEATLKFLEWFYSAEIHARWCAGAGYLPVTKSAMEHSVWKAHEEQEPWVEVFLEHSKTMKRRPFGVPQGDTGTMMDAVRLAENTAEEAIDIYCETAQEILDEFWAEPHR
jgi:multiple sugar transport system substrate-binding protein